MAVELVDRATWDAMAEEADPGFFGTSAWMEAVCSAAGMEPRYCSVTAKGQSVLRVCMALRRRWGQRRLVMPPLTSYAGWAEVLPENLAPERREGRHLEACDELAAWCEAQASFVRLALPTDVADVRPFVWRGWQAEVRYTYLVSLDSLDELPPSRTAVRNIRKAESSGIVLSRPGGADAVAHPNDTVLPTFQRQREPVPFPPDRWREYLDAFVHLPGVRVCVTTDGGDGPPTASLAYGVDRTRAYHLIGGSADAGLKNGSAAYVRWATMKEAAGETAEIDLAGANLPSIAYFKRGFGGRLVPFYAVSWARSAGARWLATGAPRWRQRLSGGR